MKVFSVPAVTVPVDSLFHSLMTLTANDLFLGSMFARGRNNFRGCPLLAEGLSVNNVPGATADLPLKIFQTNMRSALNKRKADTSAPAGQFGP